MTRKIIIKPSPKFGFYEVILMESRTFLFLKFWKEVSIDLFEEEKGFRVFSQLIEKYEINPSDVYDWSGDGFNEVKEKKHNVQSEKIILDYSGTAY